MWPIGHLQNIGHMGRNRSVDNGNIHVRPGYIENRTDQIPAVERYRLPRLQINLHAPFGFKIVDHSYQPLKVVSGSGDMMASTEINRAHLWDKISKSIFHRTNRSFEAIGILLTQIMPVQPAHSFQKILLQLSPPNAQTGPRCTRVVHFYSPFTVLRIDTNAEFDLFAGPGNIIHDLRFKSLKL